MIDWGEIIEAQTEDALKETKHWLFKEAMRLDAEKRELEQSKEKFLKERMTLKDELDTLNRKTVIERKRLREESLFFDKKMEILKAGFAQLESDRRVFEREKRNFFQDKSRKRHFYEYEDEKESTPDIAKLLFRSVNNPLALRKRYRDLVKIYHPDNLYGDEELIQQINKEFFRRKKEE